MIVDTRTFATGEAIHADLVIVGSGPAGLAMAHELDGRNIKVAVLETGGLAMDAGLNAVSDLDTASRYGGETRIENTRRVGGNANVWSINPTGRARSVRMVPFEPADFAKRPWMDHSGWPISHADYMTFIARAQAVLDLPDKSFAARDWATNEAPPLPMGSAEIETRMFQFPDGQGLVDRGRKLLETSQNITLYTYANAVELLTSAGGDRIEAIRCQSEPGKDVKFTGARFVLACNGLGVPQLMLASTANTPNGVGNAEDNVGRFFMDHPLIDGGDFVPANRKTFDDVALYDLRDEGGAPAMGFLSPSNKAVQERDIANLNMIMFPVEAGYRKNRHLTDRQALGFYSAVRIRDAIRCGYRPLVRDLASVAIGADGVVKHMLDQKRHPKFNLARGGWSKLDNRASRFDLFEVLHVAEQTPHRDNRVMLGTEKDRFGARRIKIDWTWRQQDTDAIVRAQDFMAAELKRAGIGEWRILRDKGEPVLKSASTGHFMGATRMSRDPKGGVVDTNCRVHGTQNLFVASSSVFPTGGYANPTLSIMALAIRLAEYLSQTPPTA